MERTANLDLSNWRAEGARKRAAVGISAGAFVSLLIFSVVVSAAFASLLPLQFSIVTVFLFAGPHNLLEFRYFLTRLPVRFGKSRDFFLAAFAGVALLTLTYLALPVLYHLGVWSGSGWLMALGVWNTLLILWVGALVWLRGRQQRQRDWFWAWPVAFAICASNWLAPQLFSLAIIYLHPLIAFWFLDRQLRRSRPEWLGLYRRCLIGVAVIIGLMCWQLATRSPLIEDNGLAWRISQHAGAELLPNVSSHLLVSVHVFLEMLHYIIWIVALPLLASTANIWNLSAIPLVRHPRGFPKLIAMGMTASLFLVGLLWLGFSFDYAATRDIYFAVAIAHVLAEAPFLLRNS
jgi:hypothetical protein